MTNFEIKGDDDVTLETFANFTDAKRWVDRYIRQGDWGGYDRITIKHGDSLVQIFDRERMS